MAGHSEFHSGGLHFHPPKRWQVRTGQIMCSIMWFWVFYRAKEDGPVLLGLRHPWEHGGHGHGHTQVHAHVTTHASEEKEEAKAHH